MPANNIPGIPGIGEKTALKLITQYGSLDGVLEHADQVKGKLGEKLRAGRDLALLSRELGTICRSAPLEIDFDRCRWDEIGAGRAPFGAIWAQDHQPQHRRPAGQRNSRTHAGGGAQHRCQPPCRRKGRQAVFRARCNGRGAGEGPALSPAAGPANRRWPRRRKSARPRRRCLPGSPNGWPCARRRMKSPCLAPDMLLRRMPILRDLTGAGLYDDQIYQGLKELVFAGTLCGAWRQGAMAASGPLPSAPACGEA